MRILIVNYRYFVSGGPEKYMFNIKELLEKKGHEVIPFSVHSNKNAETEYSKYFVEPIGGRGVTYFEEVKKTPKTIYQMISRSIYSFEVERAIKKEINEVKPDLVYIIHFVNKLSPSVIHGAKKMGLPVVMRLSDYHLLCPSFHFLYKKHICEKCLTNGLRQCIRQKCIKNSLFASVIRVIAMKIHYAFKLYEEIDAFVSPSEFLKDKMHDNGFGKARIECIPTFINLKDEVKDAYIGNYGLYIGRVSEEKGVEYIVKAYEQIPDHSLMIMGDDSTEEALRLKQYIKKNQIKNIIFTGFKSGKEFADIVKKSRFTVVSSICYENLPNTALESFYYYKPIIASNIGSLAELVEDSSNGLLFEPGNVEQLRRCIRKMDDDVLVENYGKRCRAIIDTKYSAEAHYFKLISLFNSLV